MPTYDKTLKKMLASGKPLDALKNQMKSIPLMVDENVFVALLEMLSLVTEFQYHHHTKMDNIRLFYSEKKSKEVYGILVPLHSMIKKCGMDQYKNDKHISFVSNRYDQKKTRFSIKKRPVLSSKQVFLSTDFNEFPQSLTNLRIQSLRHGTQFHQLMIRAIKQETREFVLKYSAGIAEKIEELQSLIG